LASSNGNGSNATLAVSSEIQDAITYTIGPKAARQVKNAALETLIIHISSNMQI